MSLSPGLRTDLQAALLDAFPTPDAFDQVVQEALHHPRARITTASGLDAVVGDVLEHCAAHGCIAALACAAYNRSPSNAQLSRLAAQAEAWPELVASGWTLDEGRATVYAPREVELAYLARLIREYQYWAEKYTPLAGMAEVRAAAAAGPRLDLPMLFMPTGFDKLEEHGFGVRREVQRVPVDDLREALTAYRRLVVLGEPGSGKTTTLWRLTFDLATAALADPAAPLPLLAPLGGYTGPEPALAYVQGYSRELAPHLPAYLAHGRVVLLLDGLNEMPQRGRKERVARIQTLLDRCVAAPVLVTCRALDFASGDAEALTLEKLEVKPLDPAHQRAYLHRYLGEADGDKLVWQMMGADLAELWSVWEGAGGTWQEFWTAHAMPEAIRRRTTWHQGHLWSSLRSADLPPLLALGANPYMLVMMAQVYAAQQGSLPQNRGKLFGAFVDALLTREEARGGKDVWPGAPVVQGALAKLAFAMQGSGERGTAVQREWARRQLDEGLEPEQLLAVGAGATLLELTGGQVRFVHQLLQEYFAALAWRARWEAGAPPAEQWPEGWLHPTGWEETAVLLAGMLPDMTGFAQALSAVNPPLAARCIAESGGMRPDDACVEQVQKRLAAIATGREFFVRHRSLAGDALNYLGDSRPGVGLTADGLPDIVWCPVPAGEFVMGNTTETDEMAFDNEAPQHRPNLGTFCIAKYPVTNAQYQAFVRDGGRARRHYWTRAGWRWRSQVVWTVPTSSDGTFDLPNHPVVGVSWFEAVAFCNWLSEKIGRQVRLPSEAQWEKAARGTDGRPYPWGELVSTEHANYRDIHLRSTSPVGIFPKGVSPCGALDMVGNTWEWTGSQYRGYPYDPDDGREDPEGDDLRTLRGGSWVHGRDNVRCAYRFGPGDKNLGRGTVGFRVVVSPGS